jgi:hypothetical protein
VNEYIGEHCTVLYSHSVDGKLRSCGLVNGTVVAVGAEGVTVEFRGCTKIVPLGEVDSIDVDPPHDPERHGLRMEDARTFDERLAVVQSWAEISRRTGGGKAALLLEEIAEKMVGMRWLAQIIE